MSIRRRIKERIIRQQFDLPRGYDYKLTIPGAPLIYSSHIDIGMSRVTAQAIRNKRVRNLLRCHYPTYTRDTTPVAVLVKFYVYPPTFIKISAKDLKAETTPAIWPHELFDYGLSFIEMLRHSLIANYTQIVKIDMQKYYSTNPRTEMQFMAWSHYVQFQDHDTLYAQSKSKRTSVEQQGLESERERHERDEEVRRKIFGGHSNSDIDRPAFGGSPL